MPSANTAADPNEPWKTEALREVMQTASRLQMSFPHEYYMQKQLGKMANAKYNWIGIKEYMKALEIAPLSEEMRSLGLISTTPSMPASSFPPTSSATSFPDYRAQQSGTASTDPWPGHSKSPDPQAHQFRPGRGVRDLYIPSIPTTPWTVSEIQQADILLQEASWPNTTYLNYTQAYNSQFKVMGFEALLEQARVFQLALQIAHRDGYFARLGIVLAAGQAGMEDPVWTDMHGDGHFEHYYSKTAGDMLQSFWCRMHLDDMSSCFQNNPVQADIARWLHLPRLVLPRATADNVSRWSEHSLAK